MEQSDIVEKLKACANGVGSFKTERGDFGLCDEAAAEITRLRAALAEKMVVKVKPLEWEESLRDRWIGTPVVKLGELAFWIFRHHDGTFKRATKDGWQYFPTLEAAKAAAQADYDSRILSAVEAVPASQIRAEALREGYRNGVEAFLPYVQLMEGCRLSNGQFNVQSRPVDYDPCSTGTDGQFNAQCVCRRRITEALALIDAPKVTT